MKIPFPPCFVIAEAGVNHNGQIQLALNLVDIAKKAGANAVKFQTYRAESLVTKQAPRASYQKENMGGEKSQYEMLKELELSFDEFRQIKRHCDQIGIQFLSTPFDEECADFLVRDLKMESIKVSSGDATNIPFLKKLATYKRPLLISTGMCSLDEIHTSVNALKEVDPELDLTLFHCTSNYPCAFDEVNLRAIKTLKQEFEIPVGYSDHTMGVEIAFAAYAMGATFIEKHFTLDKNMTGPDHKCSLSPTELEALVSGLNHLSIAMGDGIKKAMPAEESIKALVRKSVIVAKTLTAGEALTPAAVIIKRPGTGIAPADIDKIMGMRVKKDLAEGNVLSWDDLES